MILLILGRFNLMKSFIVLVSCLVWLIHIGGGKNNNNRKLKILSRVGWYVWRKRRVLVRMIGFISALVTHSLLITFTYKQYSAIAHLCHLQFTVAHALGFPVSASCLLLTGLSTRTVKVSLNRTPPISLHCSTHKVFTSHLKSSQDDCSQLTNWIELTWTNVNCAWHLNSLQGNPSGWIS
jgi:Fe2+ transport system protein B